MMKVPHQQELGPADHLNQARHHLHQSDVPFHKLQGICNTDNYYQCRPANIIIISN